MKLIYRINSILVFAIIIASVALLTVRASTEESAWIDRELKSEVSHQEKYDESKDYGAYKPSLCEEQTFFTKKLSLLDIITKNDTVTTYCALRLNTSDYVAGKYLKMGGTRIAGQLVTTGNSYKVAAGGDVVLVPHKASRTKTYIRMINDFSQQQTPRFNIITGRLQYETHYSSEQLIKDVRGRSIRWFGGGFIPTAFPNHVILDQLNGSIVRINRTTNEAIMFGKGSFTASGQSAREKVIKLSPSGRYALVGEQKTGKAYLYDLNSCIDNPTSTTTDFRYKDSMDCDFVDIGNYISTENNEGRIMPIESLKFDNEKQITMSFSGTDTENKKMYSVVRIAPGNTEFMDSPSYIAMGDSFASGEGDMDDFWYEQGTNVPENKCHLSRRSYPYLLAEQLELDEAHSVACSGARIEHVTEGVAKQPETKETYSLGRWFPGYQQQQDYLVYLSPQTITLSVGGNDVGFADKLKECVLGPGTCKYAEDSEFRSYVAMEITAMYDRLVETYSKLITKTENNTKIYVVGYPQFVKSTGGSCGLNVHLNDSEKLFISNATSYMNQVISAAAAEAGAYYLDVESALEGRNLCSNVEDLQMAINGLTEGDDTKIPKQIAVLNPLFSQLTPFGVAAESYHPNQNGHRLLERRITELTQGNIAVFNICSDGKLVCPSGVRNVPIPDFSYWGENATIFATQYSDNPNLELPRYPQNLTMIVGSSFTTTIRNFSVNLRNLQPLSYVDFELNSEPVDLGSFQADENGILAVDIEVPKGIPPGIHTLNAYAINIINEPVHYYEAVAAYDESNSEDACTFVTPSGVDVDEDGIDDACDGSYEELRTTTIDVTTTETNTDEANEDTAVALAVIETETESPEAVYGELQSTAHIPPVDSSGVDQAKGSTLGATENGVGNNEVLGEEGVDNYYTDLTLWIVVIVATVVGVSTITYKKINQ